MNHAGESHRKVSKEFKDQVKRAFIEADELFEFSSITEGVPCKYKEFESTLGESTVCRMMDCHTKGK